MDTGNFANNLIMKVLVRTTIVRRGVILWVALAIIPIMLLLVFAYSRQVGQEAIRAHRVYWSDITTKAAEGVADDAFSWFLQNQSDPTNTIAAFLKDITRNTPPSSPFSPVTIDLDQAQLRSIQELNNFFGSTVIEKCTLSLTEVKGFFEDVPSGGAFNALNEARIYPDPLDVYGLLKVEIEAAYHGYRRRFVTVRDIKCVNILPGLFGQFSLFVKEKNDGQTGDWNHLKNNSKAAPPLLDMSGFIRKETNSLSNPITLINHPDDETRTCSVSSFGAEDVSPSVPDWSSTDFSKRGWAFFGRSDRRGPLQYYIFQPMHGDVRKAATKTGIPPSIPTDPYLFFGSNFLLSNHSKLWYSLRINGAGVPAFFNQFPIPDASLSDGVRPMYGWIVWQSRFGCFSGTKALLSAIPNGQPGMTFYDLLKNVFEHPDHLIGEGPGKEELPHSSLILPMGSMYPKNSTTIVDQRSPTLLFGVWQRILQTGNITQIDDTILPALPEPTPLSAPNDWLALLSAPTNTKKPVLYWCPNFPITVNRAVTPAVVAYDGAHDRIGWGSNLTWPVVDDSLQPGPCDFSKISYNVVNDILTPIGAVKNIYEIIMTKPLLFYGMLMYEQMACQNMRGSACSLFVPGGSGPTDPQISLLDLPTDLGLTAVDSSGNPLPATQLGKRIFYSDPKPSSNQGQGLTGQGLSLKNSSGQPLFMGNLGAAWPFSEAYDLSRKATHVATSALGFTKHFLKEEAGKTILDLQGAIVLVEGDDLELKAVSGGMIYCRGGGMIIASDGEIIVKSPLVLENSTDDTLTIATANCQGNGKDIKLCAGTHESFFLSSGTLKREGAGGIIIRGGVAVRYLEFVDSASSIFYGYPSSASARQLIVWQPKFNILDRANSAKMMRIHLGARMSYWAREKMQ